MVQGGSAQNGQSGEQDTEGDVDTEAVASASDDAADSEDSAVTGDSASGDDSTSTATDDESDPANAPQSSDPSEDGDQTPSDATDEAAETEDAADTDATDPDTEDVTPAERTELFNWTGDLGALKLSSTGLVIALPKTDEPENTASEAEDAAGEQADATDDAEESATIDDAEGTEGASASASEDEQSAAEEPKTETFVPETYPAKLNLTFFLDPANADQVDTAPESIVPGDSFEVALPAGIALANPAATIDVFQAAADGTATTVKIAEATYEDGVLTVTFIAPVDTATGEARELSTYNASIDLDVLLSTSLAGETATQIEWLLQQDAAGTVQTAMLQIPARSAFEVVVELPELSNNEAIAEQEIASTDAAMNVMNVLTLPGMMNAANVEGSTTYSYENLTGSAQMAITWCDNNSSNRPDMAGYAENVIPQFLLDGDTTWIDLVDENGNLTEEARQKLHIGEGQTPNWVKGTSAAAQSIGTWNVSVQGMPTQFVETVTTPQLDEDGNQMFDEHGNALFNPPERHEVPISWRLNDTNSRPQNYTYGENDEGATGGQRYLMLTQQYTFTIQGKLGDKTLKEFFGDNLGTDAYAEYFRFSALIDNKQVVDGTGNVRSDTLEEMIEAQLREGQAFDITFSEDGNTATIKATLPQYDLNGAPIVYYAYFEDPTDTTSDKDYYQPAYNNAASPSHGSSVDKLYNGGTMTIRPVGTTSYDATKVWFDGENSDERPAASFTLWRYSTNGSPATASQVQMNAIDGSGTAAESVEYVTIEIPAGSRDNTIDLGKLLAEQYGEQDADILSNLPKYDPDGYPYIYALREDTGLSSNYEVVFGSVDSQGNETDTQPNYTDGDGNKQELDQPDRANDPFIYNDGTITNRLTGTVTVEATKTWEIAAFQDSLDTVTVTFTAQSRLASSTSDADWQDTDTTIEVDGWKAETLSQTFSGTFDQYDSQGRELEYRWIETGVSIDGEPVEFKRDGAGGGSFTLTLENMEGEPEDLAFTSTFEEATDPDGTDTITNTFDNTTYERVDKFWEQPDGTMAQIPPREAEAYGKDPADLDTDGIATVQLFQDGVLIGAFEMDGTVDPSATEIRNLPGATYQETSSYHLDFEDLPKYNPENGVRHTYLVLETQKDGWYVERIYDAETHTTTINNAVGEGEGSEIRVIKQWNDGDDSSHRLPVVVDLVAVKSMTAEQNIDPATGELYHYDPGDIVVEDIVLTAGESWYAEVDVPIGNVDYTYFKVVERGMGVVEQEDGSIEPQYPAVTYEEAEDAYEGITDDLAWINTAWEYLDTRDAVRIATEDHVYRTTAGVDAEPTYLEDMRAVTASNRRLGIFDLTIEKTWNDQGDHDRPAAELVVSCLENDQAFDVDDRGGITVSAGGANANTLPVVDNEGNQLFTGGDSIYRVEDGKLIITVDTEDDEYSSTYYIHGLPKYDGNGLVVHYDVEERGLDGSEYVTTKTVGDYNVGTRHFHDNQTIEFTNTRQGTRTVTFHKEWQDRYVNESLRQRPDIYLTLYRVTVGVDEAGNLTYSEPEQIAGYVQYLWSGTPDTEDPQYQQSCSIANLPAYDKNGSEYIYYASESMSADGSALDYTDVQFSYEGMASLHEDDGEQDAVRVPGADQESNDPTENGTGWAIHENGTFVNSLTDNLVARGTKLWEDVPANVNQGSAGDLLVESDLPEITVYLQQRVEGGEWQSLKFEVNEDGSWDFADGTSAIAWTSDLKQVTTNQYSYSMAHTGENTITSVDNATAENPTLPENEELLPRYTEDGKLYEYRAIEVAWGLVDQPGGVRSEWIEQTDFSQLRESDDDSMGVYVIKHGETGSFLINNVYTSETGSLTVQKHYTGREAGDLYPETTFDVYRYYVNADGEKSDAALVDSVTLTNDMLKNGEQLNGLTVTGAGEAETTAQYTFSGLDIYAPDGSYWQYYVVEHNINGYQTTVEVGNVAAEDVTGEGETADGGVSSGGLCEESGTVEAPEPGGDSGDGTSTSKVTGTVLATDKVAEDGSITPGDTTPDVTFKNEYTPEPVDLTGTKTWVDFNNIFNIRPTAEEFVAGLKVERIDNGKTVDLGEGGLGLLQSDDPDAPYFFTVSENEGTNTYTITLSNVDKWSPDGTAYRYRITETLTNMVLGETDRNAGGYYTTDNAQDPTTATSTVNAQSPGSVFRFTNTLEGQATVEKKWNDGEDPYGLRPTTVTVRLQARYTYADGEASAWQDPEQILRYLGHWDEFESQFKTEADAQAFFEKTLSADTGWRGSWTGLPMGGRGTATGHDGELFSIEYRAVEVAIGNQEIEQPTSADVTFTYTNSKADDGEYHPYQPKQDSWTSTANSSATTISNTLETTQISATKTWEGDNSNAWDTRGGDEWTVHYLLQRRLEGPGDEGWQWLMEYGADQAGLDAPFAEGIVSQTISGEGDSAVANWENLPDCDEDGTPYEYRVVEQVPGSYDVTDASAELVVEATEPTTRVTYRYYVVDSVEGGDAGDAQTFTNTLRTVELTGTKRWDDHGTTLADNLTEADMPDMVLYRATMLGNGKFGPTENVTSYAGQPTWEGSGESWTFTYTGLPAANEDDVDYVYWAVEKEADAPGYYPLYGTDKAASPSGAAGTTVTTSATAAQDGVQTNESITNVATRFTLDKLSDFTPEGEDAREDLRDIELTVYGADGDVYAVWTDTDGVASSTVWPKGRQNGGETEMTGENAGFIVGLPAGTYTVKETGEVPEGYAKALDVTITIANNGKITAAQSGNDSVLEVEDTNPGGTITVNVEDPVLRGHLRLTKHVSDNGAYGGTNDAALAGATFSLYRVDMDGDGEDELIASGLTSNSQGIVDTRNFANVSIEVESTAGVDLTYGGKYVKLSDGLPAGEYYFVETATTSGAVMPDEANAKSATLEITQDTHFAFTNAPVATTMGNERFNANVVLHKFDTLTNEPIQGAKFQVDYTPSDGSTGWVDREFTTGSDGSLKLENLKKGTYVITEVSNTGYVSNGFRATFTLTDANDDVTYDIKSIADGKDIDFEVTSGADDFVDGQGIPNVPQRGTVTIDKTGKDGAALNGATFELQRLGEDGQTWETIIEGLETGTTYKANDANDGIEGSGSTGAAGRLQVTNLLWGTYRFVETEPADGYFCENADGNSVTSGTLTIDRTHLNPSLTGTNAVANEPTSLEINKANDVGQPLAGAEFQITAQDDSAFAHPSEFAAGTYDEATKTVTLATDSTGHIELVGQLMVGGTYTIYESGAPSGYDPADGVLTVTVQGDGSLAVQGDMPDRYAWADLDEDGHADNAYSFMVTNIHEEIDILKVDDDGDALEGAEFTLTGLCMDKNTSHTYTTDEDGYIHVDAGLMGGVRYELRESKPADGYAQLEESLYFMMDERGEIVVTDAQQNPLDEEEYPEGYAVNSNHISLTVTDEPVKLQITKRAPAGEDGEPGETLPWAEFSITPVNDSKFAAGADPTATQTMRTGEDGTLSMTAWLIVGDEYDITEVKAPEGYERVTGTMRIRVEEDGSISVVGSVNEDGSITPAPPTGYTKVDDNTFEVSVVNEPIEINIEKVGSNDTATGLEGAEFKVTGVFAGSNEVETRTFTTSEGGRVEIEAELKSRETYTLREVVAPAGYELLEGELTVQVAEDGTLEIVGDAPAGYTLADGGVTIFAVDEPLSISFVKTDEEGGALAGATFSIAPAGDGATFPDGSASKTFTSNENGLVFEDLQLAGSAEGAAYVIAELTAPAGYEVAPAFTILVFEDGTVELGDVPGAIAGAVSVENAAVAAAGEGADASGDDAGAPALATPAGVVVTLADTRVEAQIAKVSTSGGALAGAEFAVTGLFTDGYTTKAVTVDANGRAPLEGLIVGETYRIRETVAPEGFDLIEETWEFTVQADGTLAGEATSGSADEAGYAIADDGVTLRAVDAPTPPVPGEMPGTGDTKLTYALVLGIVSLVCLAGGLRLSRRKR